ncbi:MAG TPA: cupin domain-containing protein, partial [Nitrospira sp.]|nr:cupin domain-containing protein [Nitrospira sp.]
RWSSSEQEFPGGYLMSARTLHNPRTGETITFTRTSRDTGGGLFEMNYKMAPHAAIADEHSHPHQEMIISVLSGTLTCTVDGADKKIQAGAKVIIPAGVFHFQRNDSETEVQAVEQYRPALQMQEFFEVLIGWANDNKTNEWGLPTPLRSAVMHRYFKRSIRSSSKWRNLMAWLLAPLGRALGYQREVEHYVRLAAQGDRQ